MNVLPVALNTYKEAIRDKILYVILLFSIVMISSSILFSMLSLGQTKKVIIDFGLASISIFGVLITLFVGTSLLSKEIEKKTIFLLLTKPLKKRDFILGKHLGLSLTLFIIVVLMTITFYGVIIWLLKDYSFVYAQAILLNYVELVLLVAFAIFFSTFSSPILSSMYTLAIYIVGHFSKDLLNLGEMTENQTFISITKVIYYVLPDLDKLNLKNIAIYQPEGISNEIFTGGLIYGLVYTIIVLVLATITFRFKEF